jgi:hypothetical protein
MFFRADTRRLPGWRCVEGGEEAGTSDTGPRGAAIGGFGIGDPLSISELERRIPNSHSFSIFYIFLEVFATVPVDLFRGSDL